MKCDSCGQENFVKNGFNRGLQRWKCKNCGFQVTKPGSRKSQAHVNFAIYLYVVGLSFRTVGKIIGVSDVTISRWVRAFAELNYEKPCPKGEIVVELDEMWHYVGSKKTNYGYGRHIVEKLGNLSTGNVVIGTQKPWKKCVSGCKDLRSRFTIRTIGKAI